MRCDVKGDTRHAQILLQHATNRVRRDTSAAFIDEKNTLRIYKMKTCDESYENPKYLNEPVSTPGSTKCF